MMYEETFLTSAQIDDLAESELYFNDEWLDDLDDDDFDIFPNEEFWEHCDELEADSDFLPTDEIPDYTYSYYFDYND